MINSFHEGRGIFYTPPPPNNFFISNLHIKIFHRIHYQVLFSIALIIAIAKNKGVRTSPPSLTQHVK